MKNYLLRELASKINKSHRISRLLNLVRLQSINTQKTSNNFWMLIPRPRDQCNCLRVRKVRGFKAVAQTKGHQFTVHTLVPFWGQIYTPKGIDEFILN